MLKPRPAAAAALPAMLAAFFAPARRCTAEVELLAAATLAFCAAASWPSTALVACPRLDNSRSARERCSVACRTAARAERGEGNLGFISAASKCFASDVAMEVTTDAVQIFGGAGYTVDFPVERMMRDAKITQIYEGTNQIQRVVMSRALLR